MPRRLAGFLLGWLVILGASLAAPSSDATGGAGRCADIVAARALVGATLFDGTGGPPVADAVGVLCGGAVECAGSRAACPVPAGVELRPAQP